MSLSATIAGPIALRPVVRSKDQCLELKKNVRFNPVGFKPLGMQFSFERRFNPVCLKPLGMQFSFERRSLTHAFRVKHASVICAAALNATCAAEQTQTITRESSTITVAPIQGKEKSPDLDDGGAGLPPRDDGDGGGGGGGGGHWSGGFFFFGFLAFLGLLKDQESEGPYREKREKRRR